jgi:hypothetical protein
VYFLKLVNYMQLFFCFMYSFHGHCTRINLMNCPSQVVYSCIFMTSYTMLTLSTPFPCSYHVYQGNIVVVVQNKCVMDVCLGDQNKLLGYSIS